MADLITDSLEYPARGDTFLRTVAVGGAFMFAYQIFLGAVFDAVTPGGGVGTGSFADGASTVVQGGLVTLGLLSFVVLTGFYVRIAERVAAGEETPPEFSDSRRLVLDGALFCATLLAIVVATLAVQFVVFTVLIVSLTVADLTLGVPAVDTVLVSLQFLFAVVLALAVVYPQPSLWIVLARFRLESEANRPYLRFVTSRRVLSGLGSIWLSRRYVSSWGALVVVSVLQGAATVEGGSVFAVHRPVDLVVRLNTRFVSAIVGFYASVAVVFIFATRLRELDRGRQTSLDEFASPDGP